MKLIKITQVNKDVYINPEQVCQISKDPFDEKNILVSLSDRTVYKLKLTIEEVLNLFEKGK